MLRRIILQDGAARCGGIAILAVAMACWSPPRAAEAQVRLQAPNIASRSVPPPRYFFIFNDFLDGEFNKAGKDFNDEGRGAIKNATSHWIDSICFHAMAGECLYQMGKLPEALDHFNNALALYSAFSDWMIRVQFPPTIQRENVGQIFNCPWGQSTRNAVIGSYPNTMSIGQGNFVTQESIRAGGPQASPLLYPINVQEIVRCTTLAMRRRRELLGPASAYDRLANDVFAALSRRPGPANHWGDAWIGVQLGIAASASGKDAVARTELEQSVVAAGEFDHPMTCIALLELGRLDLQAGDFPTAAQRFLEASISAGQFNDFGIIEEALRQGLAVHLLSNQQGMYPPLEPAAAWAKKYRYFHLQACLETLIAENYNALGETQPAVEAIARARGAVARRAMAAGRTGARLSYVNAQALYAQDRPDQAAAMLDNAMSYQSEGSIWLFQLFRADHQYMKGEIQARVAMELYTQLLRDPQAVDWATEPMEAMAVLVHPHGQVYENWFAAALERREPERAFEIADLIRRHRFLSTLELGGRLVGLRWLLDGPPELLDPQATLERQELLTSFPAYQELARKADALRTQLRQLPAKSDDPDQQRSQAKSLTEWAKISLAQERLLREMALRRKAASLVFPPIRSLDEIQDNLAPGTALLSFLSTEQHGVHGFLITAEKGKYDFWDVPEGAVFQKKLVAFLRAMGHYDPNAEVDAKTLAGDDWRAPGREIWQLLTKGSKAEFPGSFTELAIVPDGALWYLPFEALPTSDEADAEPLLTRIRLRYAPTNGLAVPNRRPRGQGSSTAVIAGKLYSRDDTLETLATAESIAKAIPGAAVFDAPPTAPSVVYRTLFDRLLVLSDIPAPDRDYYAWSPMGIEKGNLGGSLGVWFGLPWGSPDQIILPGFHTAAERALQKTSQSTMGADVFLSLCGLMSTGSRTVLISRWRTGGNACYELMREFTQELPHSSASAAWQRSVMLARDGAVDSERDPRVKRTTNPLELTAKHPFFWSGYLLADPGLEPPADDDANAPLQQAARP